MIQFRQKDFSNYILRDAVKGASIGSFVGSIGYATKMVPAELPKWVPGASKYNELKNKKTTILVPKMEPDPSKPGKLRPVKKDGNPVYEAQEVKDSSGKSIPSVSHDQRLIFAATTTLLGAALGAIVGIVKTVNDKYSQSRVNQRLLKRILPRLKSEGLVEGKDYTMDPKKANEIPTKVCIVLSSASGELQTIINSKDDPKLKKVVDKVVKKSPGRSQVTTQNNRFNEITITTEKNTAANVNQVVSIIESFVESGYPVYIVEVG